MMVYLLSFPDIDVQFFTNPDLYHLDALIALKFDFDELFLNGPVSINLNYKARWFKSWKMWPFAKVSFSDYVGQKTGRAIFYHPNGPPCTSGFRWFNSWRLLIFGVASSVCQRPQVVISKPNVAGFEESVWRGFADDRNDSNSRHPRSALSTPSKVSPYVPKINHIASRRLWMFFLPRMMIGLTKKLKNVHIVKEYVSFCSLGIFDCQTDIRRRWLW